MQLKNFTYRSQNSQGTEPEYEPVEEQNDMPALKSEVGQIRENQAENLNAPEPNSVKALQNDETFIPETLESTIFIPGFLTTQIGQYIKAEFLAGTMMTDRTGILDKVGANYIILRQQNGDEILCDLFSIKFITITRQPR